MIYIPGLPDTNSPLFNCATGTICNSDTPLYCASNAVPSCQACGTCTADGRFACTGLNTFALCYGGTMPSSDTYTCPINTVCDVNAPAPDFCSVDNGNIVTCNPTSTQPPGKNLWLESGICAYIMCSKFSMKLWPVWETVASIPKFRLYSKIILPRKNIVLLTSKKCDAIFDSVNGPFRKESFQTRKIIYVISLNWIWKLLILNNFSGPREIPNLGQVHFQVQ